MFSSSLSHSLASERPTLDPALLRSFQTLERHPLRLPIFIGLYAIALLITMVLVSNSPHP